MAARSRDEGMPQKRLIASKVFRGAKVGIDNNCHRQHGGGEGIVERGSIKRLISRAAMDEQYCPVDELENDSMGIG